MKKWERNFFSIQLMANPSLLKGQENNTILVPVPKVLGYGDGKDAFPPFLITENVGYRSFGDSTSVLRLSPTFYSRWRRSITRDLE